MPYSLPAHVLPPSQMTSLSLQVSQVSQHLQEMTRLLKPLLQPLLLQGSSQSVLSSLMAALTPPTSETLSSSAPPPPKTPSNTNLLLLEDTEIGEVGRERRHPDRHFQTPSGGLTPIPLPHPHPASIGAEMTPTSPVQLSFIDEERPTV